MVDVYGNDDQPIQFFFPLFGKPIDSLFVYSDDDLEAIEAIKKFPRAIHFGDPDVAKRNYASKEVTSARLELQKIGIYVQSIGKNDFFHRRETTKIYLNKGLEVNANSPRTEDWLEAVKMARYPQREEISQATTPVTTPIHDWTSHPRTAMEYFFINIDIYANVNTEEPAWAEKAKDSARGAVGSITSRNALMRKRR